MHKIFTITASISLLLWLLGLAIYTIPAKTLPIRNKLGLSLFSLGTLLTGVFITCLWIKLERPPFRTLGETRLLYTFFLAFSGIIITLKWKIRWMMYYTGFMASLFLMLNYVHPENFEKTLMPALQSPWFAPHVIVYIIAYALLAISALYALQGLYKHYFTKSMDFKINQTDNIVYAGFAFLSFGLLFGALWAKEAWGHYWTWDPKETWAFITWAFYLFYIHVRKQKPKATITAFWILALAFVFLLTCWFGLEYLPTGQNSVHTYTNS